MVRSELYRECTGLLESAGIPDREFDAMCIFQDVLRDRNPLFMPQKEVSAEEQERIMELINGRIQGRPLQYLLGQWDFWNCTFKVGDGVLIPRPDTETLMENVLDICRREKMTSPKIADLCSGSGCLAVSLKKELPFSSVTAVELSEKALPYLRENAKLNSADITILAADVLSPETAAQLRELDIIVSNPPYLTAQEMTELQAEVREEPEMALYGGTDGLDFYRAMTPLWKESLRPGGWLCYEFGMGQHEEVGKILAGNGFVNIKFTRDAGGIVRTAAAQRSEENNGKKRTCKEAFCSES